MKATEGITVAASNISIWIKAEVIEAEIKGLLILIVAGLCPVVGPAASTVELAVGFGPVIDVADADDIKRAGDEGGGNFGLRAGDGCLDRAGSVVFCGIRCTEV